VSGSVGIKRLKSWPKELALPRRKFHYPTRAILTPTRTNKTFGFTSSSVRATRCTTCEYRGPSSPAKRIMGRDGPPRFTVYVVEHVFCQSALAWPSPARLRRSRETNPRRRSTGVCPPPPAQVDRFRSSTPHRRERAGQPDLGRADDTGKTS
jgi:hypothetical protein